MTDLIFSVETVYVNTRCKGVLFWRLLKVYNLDIEQQIILSCLNVLCKLREVFHINDCLISARFHYFKQTNF